MNIPDAKSGFAGAEENLHAASRTCNYAKEVSNDIPFGEMSRLLGQLSGFTIMGAEKKSKTSTELWEAKQTAEEATKVFGKDTALGTALAENTEKTKLLAQRCSDASEYAKLLGVIDQAKAIVGRLQTAHDQSEREIDTIAKSYEELAVQVHNEAEQI